MAYRIELRPAAKRDLKKVDTQALRRIDAAILLLKKNPRPPKAEALHGKWRGYLRIRVGDYRIIYYIQDDVLVVCVVRVRKRDEVY